jgi:hypothetical protein
MGARGREALKCECKGITQFLQIKIGRHANRHQVGVGIAAAARRARDPARGMGPGFETVENIRS